MVWDDIRILKIMQNSHLKGASSQAHSHTHTHAHTQEGVGPSGNTDRKLPTSSDYLNMPKRLFTRPTPIFIRPQLAYSKLRKLKCPLFRIILFRNHGKFWAWKKQNNFEQPRL